MASRSDVTASSVVGGGERPSAQRALAIEVERLTKIFPDRRDEAGRPVASVSEVDFSVRAGEIFGLLGRNGAGKSTTVRMIATLLEPTSGTVRVGGLDVRHHLREVRARLGVALGGERSVYWKLTARQNLEFFASLYGTSRRRSRARISELLEAMDLTDRADDYVERYSTGMRQRLVIARAVLNRPDVVLLDEPASGLDPHGAENLHTHIRRLRDAGHTILLTTHDMAEADLLSDQVGIINAGRMQALGTPAQLKASVGAARLLHIQVREPEPERLSAFLDGLRTRADIRPPAEPDQTGAGVRGFTLCLHQPDDPGPWLFRVAADHRVTVLRMENEPVTLRDAFLAITKGPADGESHAEQ